MCEVPLQSLEGALLEADDPVEDRAVLCRVKIDLV